MRFGVRRPSIKGRISARTSWKRYVRHSMGFKAPRGAGWFTNPKKALYNRVYNRTTVSVDDLFKVRTGSARSSRLPALPPGLMNLLPRRTNGELSFEGLFGLLVVFSLPTLGLLWLGVGVTWSILIPIALFLIVVFGEVIGTMLQVLGIIIGLIPALFIGYLFLKIFIIH